MVATSVPDATLEPKTHQGYFAEAFVASIAAAAGLDVFLPRLGHRVDLQVYSPGPLGTSSSRQIVLQVKSWSVGRLSEDDHFHYDLDVPAYNYLAGSGHDVRHYLVLAIVPRNPARYADAQPRRLLSRYAAYWLSLKDMEADNNLSPKSTKTVLVPRRNLITPLTIRALVERQEELAVVR